VDRVFGILGVDRIASKTETTAKKKGGGHNQKLHFHLHRAPTLKVQNACGAYVDFNRRRLCKASNRPCNIPQEFICRAKTESASVERQLGLRARFETFAPLPRKIFMPWGRRLKAPIALHDGRQIKTLADARALINTLPALDQQNERWLYLTELLMSAAEGKWGALGVATDQLHLTLRDERLL
jgi:hypothetical protein